MMLGLADWTQIYRIWAKTWLRRLGRSSTAINYPQMAGPGTAMKTQFYEDGSNAIHVDSTLCKNGAWCAATIDESSFDCSVQSSIQT